MCVNVFLHDAFYAASASCKRTRNQKVGKDNSRFMLLISVHNRSWTRASRGSISLIISSHIGFLSCCCFLYRVIQSESNTPWPIALDEILGKRNSHQHRFYSVNIYSCVVIEVSVLLRFASISYMRKEPLLEIDQIFGVKCERTGNFGWSYQISVIKISSARWNYCIW